VQARDALTDICELGRALGAHPVADFFAIQDEGCDNAVQQHLVPLVAESTASSCARPLLALAHCTYVLTTDGIGP
jgi:hypothetical protein